jgi:ADP-heptose:LPS heptosyltransferase
VTAGPAAADVLVLRALGLGDALTGVPALRGLRRAFPDRRLLLAAPEAVGAWLTALGVVDTVLPARGLEPLPWSGPGGHVAVDLHGRGPRSHRVLAATGPARLIAFGCAAAGHDGPPWREAEHEVDRWCRLVASTPGDDGRRGTCGPEDLRLDVAPAGDPDVVLLHPGAASGSRRWPADRWGALGALLTAEGHPVAVTGGPGERALCAEVAARAGGRDLAGSVDLPGLAALVAGARLLVCGDTGVAHLATALGTPSVLLFGPTSPDRWGPRLDPDRHEVLWHGPAARPGDPHAAALNPTLARTTVPEVAAAAARALARSAAPDPRTPAHPAPAPTPRPLRRERTAPRR